ncbi:substrate-binding domain-containing protein [Ornithinibacillus sp. L9]|uniref:Substrate-binding domain-containing protein n=1 Tax=Ornithinibacillus caprae TaxID=2678566 RepID=A0A6N8FEU8_9BACI|nr:sugar-binding protein [Ornithinibacillus caprae]MUK87721.1 substrate-binding domain-containing protein [Ornithinibacillus caprae]
MNLTSKSLIYLIGVILFLISFIGMIYFGYKTFYIEAENNMAPQEYTYHFALIAEESANDYWRLIEQGAKEAAKEHDIYLEYVAPQKADNDEMLKLLDRMISAQVDGIITQGIEGDRFIDIVHKATERGIPVVTVDTDIKSSERKAYVGTDNFYAGQLLGNAIIDHTSGEQYVGVVTGRFDAVNQQERLEGLKDVIKDHPRIQIVSIKESNITEVGATQATYSMLKEYPSITALVGTSALDGFGMVEGLREIAPNKDLYMVAFDVLPETLQLILQERIDGTISQAPKEMGYSSVEVMLDLQTGDLLKNEFFTETKLIQKHDLEAEENGVRR